MSILDTIVAQKQVEVARLPARRLTVEGLRETVARHEPRRDFTGALRHPHTGDVALIAEVKKASPSAGVIWPDFDPLRLAREYEAAGASCLSVLTDERFFQGSLQHLKGVRQVVGLPLLRKDFIIDERQILESLEWGADAILLIVAILEDRQLSDYQALAGSLGLAALVEVHDEGELDRAVNAGAALLGINNRDLNTFQVDLATTGRLAARLRHKDGGQPRLLVSESGIQTRPDVEMLRESGACAILVGESLARGVNIASKVTELIGGSPHRQSSSS